MVSHVTSLISTVCDTLEGYFLDQFSPWKIITLSVAITITVKVKITGVSVLNSSPKPATLLDSAFKHLHTFSRLSVYVEIHSGTLISFWQQMPSGHFLVICWGKDKEFYMMQKIICSCLLKKPLFSALSLFICKLKHVFSCYYLLLIFSLYHWHYL